MADPEYLGEVALATAGPARQLLSALASAGPDDLPSVMAGVERALPGLAAALACYVGTCTPVRSAAPAR